MTRVCFVIMPFSSTGSCKEEEWTWIFNNVFKPAVEGAGLDYECRRSNATRGNIVAGILQDLRDAYVVLAEVTDRNPNVLYELGVRHSLSVRSIILAQKRDDIPFDLQPYANHVYDWKTEEGRSSLSSKLRELLTEVDISPERPDNPVSDFLGRSVPPIKIPEPPAVSRSDVVTAQALAGAAADGLNAADFARKLITEATPAAIKSVYRLTWAELEPLLSKAIESLDKRPVSQSVQTNQIPAIASEYITAVEPHIKKAEEFFLACVENDWVRGIEMGLRLEGKVISFGELLMGVRTKFVKGLPSLLAWRSLILMGAKATGDDSFESLRVLLREPIEVEGLGNQISYQSFPQRSNLFYPDVFLGHPDYGIKYISNLWKNNLHLHPFFGSEKDYYIATGEFLMIVALANAGRLDGYTLVPGYRLLPQATIAMQALCGRLATSDSYLENIARSMGESSADFRKSWSQRVARANSAKLGSEDFHDSEVRFPDPMNGNV